MNPAPLSLLWFNLVTDADAPSLAFTTEWVNALAPHCARIDVISMRIGRLALAENARAHSLGKERGHSEFRRGLEFYRLLWGLLRAWRYDACFAHMQPLFAAMGAPLLRAYGVPLTLWYAHRATPLRLRLAAQCAQRIVTPSRESFRLASDRTRVIGHGIDTERFVPAASLLPPPFIMLHTGRLAPVKGLETILTAAELLRDAGAEFRLRLVGAAYPQDRSWAESLRARVAAVGMEGHVQFVGAVSRERVIAELQGAHVLVNMSATGSLDKAPLEAMSCAVPVITANEAFIPLLAAWRGLLLTPPDDAQALARRIQSLMSMDADRHAALGAELRALIEREHSMTGLVARLLGVLRTGEPA